MPDQTPVLIRPAVAADIPVIASFIRELADFERLSDEVRFDEERLTHNLFGPVAYAHVLLAEVDVAPAGFCLYFYNFSTFLGQPGIYIEDIYVRNAYRQGGIGKKLFAEIFSIAADKNCGRIEWSVLDWNQFAIEFYTKLGAQPVSGWKVYRLNRDKFAAVCQKL